MNPIERQLKRPFSDKSISWRVGSTNQEKTKGIALAYIDARDVMHRLDEVFPMTWQCKYSHAEGKTICEIGVKTDGEWIWRAGGAGDTDIEAEKGAISDAFKRAAVLWGIGQYLYSLPNEWVDLTPSGRSYKLSKTPSLPKWATPTGWDDMVDNHERMQSIVLTVRSLMKENNMKAALEVWAEVGSEPVELQTEAWFLFDSTERSTIKKALTKE